MKPDLGDGAHTYVWGVGNNLWHRRDPRADERTFCGLVITQRLLGAISKPETVNGRLTYECDECWRKWFALRHPDIEQFWCGRCGRNYAHNLNLSTCWCREHTKKYKKLCIDCRQVLHNLQDSSTKDYLHES